MKNSLRLSDYKDYSLTVDRLRYLVSLFWQRYQENEEKVNTENLEEETVNFIFITESELKELKQIDINLTTIGDKFYL